MKNWETILISSDTSIEKSIEVLNQGGQCIALVVDTQRYLLGTVTDGDIRRALLKHMSMDSPINQIMCATPKKANVDWNKELILSTMEQHKLLQLPIVNSDGQLVGLQTLHDILKSRHHDNQVFLVAGGVGDPSSSIDKKLS